MTRVSMEGVPDFDKFEIVRKGKVTLASPNSAGSSTNVSVTHSLGYQPLVMAFVAIWLAWKLLGITLLLFIIQT